jgi:MraZ protein
MFRGRYDHTLDPKGRFNLPAKYREILAEKYNDQLYLVSLADGQNLRIYPLKEWEEVEAKIAQLPSMDQHIDSFMLQVSYYSCECTLDKAGRVLIPQTLRDHVGLTRDITLIGKLKFIEVWDKNKLISKLEETKHQSEEFRSYLAGIGI